MIEAELNKKEQRTGASSKRRAAPSAAPPPKTQRAGAYGAGLGKPLVGTGKPLVGTGKPLMGVDLPMPSAPKPPTSKPKRQKAGQGSRTNDPLLDAIAEGDPLTPTSPASFAGSVGSIGSAALDFGELEEGVTESNFMQFIDDGTNDMPLPEHEGIVDEAPAVGMHVVVDAEGSGAPPTSAAPVGTSARPAPSNVGLVVAVHNDATCDVRLLDCQGCSEGKLIKRLQPHQRAIACSGCLCVNLPMALPTLRCSGCDKHIKNGSTYHRDRDPSRRVKLCSGCFDDLGAGTIPEHLRELDDLHEDAFEKTTWRATEEEDYDHYVQCEGECRRWYHYICGNYPDVSLLPRDKTLEQQAFICNGCRSKLPPTSSALARSEKLYRLQTRKAAELPTCRLSDAIEGHVSASLRKAGKACRDLTVRVVSNKQYTYPAIAEMKSRYGDAYPEEFPYQSKMVLAFQTIQGRDVCCFAMYVQEYGPHCPQPNTNRTYISYLDSVPYLQTSPAGERTFVYHAIINGYLKHACRLGYEFAHIWVAPPQSGDEYIFHCRPHHPKHGHRAMSMSKLRSWYEALLAAAAADDIVRDTHDISSEVEHLTSVRDFPLFYGDFFPDELSRMLKPAEPASSSRGPPTLVRESSLAIAQKVRKRAKEVRKRFLVAKLNTAPAAERLDPTDVSNAPHRANDLVDSRLSFLHTCISRHWQFDELRRAHYSTMMLLADLGGAS